MAMYVFSTTGEPVGFVFESFVYDFEGVPLGRILGPHVHRLDGSYVGEWFHDMVVDKKLRSPQPIRAVSPPLRREPPPRVWRRRPVQEHRRYADAFARLQQGEPLLLAAE